MGPTYAAFSELKIHREQQQERQQQQENDGFEKRPSTAMRGNSGGEDNDTARGADAKESGGEPVGSSDNNPTVAARLKLISWYAGRESSALAKELYGNEVGQHATPDEVRIYSCEKNIVTSSLCRSNPIMNIYVLTRDQGACSGHTRMSSLYFVHS